MREGVPDPCSGGGGTVGVEEVRLMGKAALQGSIRFYAQLLTTS